MFLSVSLPFARVAAAQHSSMERVGIFLYHHVSELPATASDALRRWNVTPRKFEEQIGWFAEHGHPTSLPVVPGRAKPLTFRAWRPGEPVISGVLGIPMPAAGAPEIVPEIVLVPLLAFDRRGYRLGYGGGYYDRTLAGLRAKGPTFAIGVGFAFQEIDEVPTTPGDQPVDAIATEAGWERFA